MITKRDYNGGIRIYVISYLLAIITGGVGIFTWIRLRELLFILLAKRIIGVGSWKAISTFTLLICGIIWISLFIFSRNYYEQGAKRKYMLYNFSFIMGIQLLLISTIDLIILIIALGQIGSYDILYIIGLLAIGLTLVFLPKLFPGKTHK